mmetsp:Transcript_15495/g.31346  ORF Transcript_15495/g.31346 Transcript_15495/m.31346 type:complete len:253 (+) Transcript_15495:171-929(+)
MNYFNLSSPTSLSAQLVLVPLIVPSVCRVPIPGMTPVKMIFSIDLESEPSASFIASWTALPLIRLVIPRRKFSSSLGPVPAVAVLSAGEIHILCFVISFLSFSLILFVTEHNIRSFYPTNDALVRGQYNHRQHPATFLRRSIPTLHRWHQVGPQQPGHLADPLRCRRRVHLANLARGHRCCPALFRRASLLHCRRAIQRAARAGYLQHTPPRLSFLLNFHLIFLPIRHHLHLLFRQLLFQSSAEHSSCLSHL